MTDEDGGGADPPQRAGDRGDVALECVEAVLAGHHLVPLRLKRGDHLAEARAVGPDPVDEHDAGFGLRGHRQLPGTLSVFTVMFETGAHLEGKRRATRERLNDRWLAR